VALVGGVVLAVGVAGCIPPRPSPTSVPIDTGAPSPSVTSPSGEPGGSPAGSASPAGSVTAGGVAVDPALLDHLPPNVGGLARTADPETAGEIARQQLLDLFVSDIAVAIYPSDADYAVATVARLKDGVFDEAWFRDWRDTFDTGVCSQAGGVDTGRSEIELGGRPVHRSSCQGGVVIYHAWLPDSGVVVSVQGAGPLDAGRSVVSGLTE
jgi:hypothetical protein